MKRIVNLVSFIVLLYSLLSAADNYGPMLAKSYLLFGLNEYYYHYSEIIVPDSGKSVGTPKSNEYGATSLFHLEGKSYSKTSPFYGGFSFDYGGAIQKYDGSTQDSFYVSGKDTIRVYLPLMTNKSNTFTKIEGFFGPYFGNKDYLIGLHAGFLYYYWNRQLGNLPEFYTWYYLPIGAELSFMVNNSTSFGCNVEYRLMLGGNVQFGLDYYNIQGLYASVPQLTLGTRDGFLIEFPLRTNINRNLSLECKPWFEYRPSGISNKDTMLIEQSPGMLMGSIYLEPDSKSFSIGITLSAMVGNYSQAEAAQEQHPRAVKQIWP